MWGGTQRKETQCRKQISPSCTLPLPPSPNCLTLIESSYFANTSKINRSLSVKHTVKEIPTDLSFLSHSPSVSPAPDLAGVQNHILGDPSALWRATLAGLKAAGPVQAPTSVHCSNGALLMTQTKACNFL